MEYAGLIALILILVYSGLPGKVKRLAARVKRLEARERKGGDLSMSKLLKELEGKQCTLVLESDFPSEIKCTVLQVEDEWLKVVERDKKGRENIRLLRTENIKEVQEIV
ncbi:MAG: hypothetical protein ACOX2G_07420 [Bacillota bacterium]|jgi:hypothetical protein